MVVLPDSLPPPDAAAQNHSIAVTRRIRDAIARAGGAIPFVEFMQLALYAPGLGYYSAGAQKFGEAGDFVTAPEISPLFSRCMAQQIGECLKTVGGGDILEVGAGSGTLACDMLAELQAIDRLPDAYFILEVSADLRARQRARIAATLPHLLERVRWLDALPGAEFCGVVVANELLDAMPVHRFSVNETGFCESYVTWDDNRFAWLERPLRDGLLLERLQHIVASLESGSFDVGYVSEVNLAMEAWLVAIEAMLSQGVVLLIDYGFPRHEYYMPARRGGTLACHFRHRVHYDPLVLPGIQDITAHVDFSAVAEVAINAGLTLEGYTTQAHFLLASGLERFIAASDPLDAKTHLQFTQQVKKLTLPSEMGELFKVIAFSKGYPEQSLSGFALHDLRGKL